MQISLKAGYETEPVEGKQRPQNPKPAQKSMKKAENAKRMAKGKLLSCSSLVWLKVFGLPGKRSTVLPRKPYLSHVFPAPILTLPLPDFVFEIAYECWPIGFG